MLDQAIDASSAWQQPEDHRLQQVRPPADHQAGRRRGRRRRRATSEAGGASTTGPIEVLDEDGDEQPILPFTETRRAPATSPTSLYVIRPGSSIDGEYVQGLIGANMIEHVAVGLLGTYYSDIVEANMGLAMFHPRSACRLKGLTCSPALISDL
jgi:hypothetical protein